MTVKNYFGDTPVRTAAVKYQIRNPQGELVRTISRQEAAAILSDPELPVGWVVQRTIFEYHAPGCPWCGVRPVQWERDCDGWASTGTCGSPQCNQLKRCDGCGKDNQSLIVSYRGRLCSDCDKTAYDTGRVAAYDRYELIPA